MKNFRARVLQSIISTVKEVKLSGKLPINEFLLGKSLIILKSVPASLLSQLLTTASRKAMLSSIPMAVGKDESIATLEQSHNMVEQLAPEISKFTFCVLSSIPSFIPWSPIVIMQHKGLRKHQASRLLKYINLASGYCLFSLYPFNCPLMTMLST